LRWTKKYPNPVIVKKEIDVMINTIVKSLLKAYSRKEIKGIYLKGSANKRWDTIVDYVPEISDIDIHVLFWKNSMANDFCRTFTEALNIKKQIEIGYHRSISNPIHLPRPQITVINHLQKQENYEPSPSETVKVLFGSQYPGGTFDEKKPSKKAYIKMILTEKDFLARYPLQIVDKPGKYNFVSLRLISWRISAIGPKILVLHNIQRKEAWSLNHTGVYRKLSEIGHRKLADDYALFYKKCWDYFLGHFQDGKSASVALISGVNVLKRTIAMAEKISGNSYLR